LQHPADSSHSATTELWGDITRLFSGNAFASAVLLISAPLIARIYSPEDFGVFSWIAAIVAIFPVLSSLGYSTAVLLPKDERDAVSLAQLSLVITTIIALFVFVLSRFLVLPHSEQPIERAYSVSLPAIPVLIFLSGLCVTLRNLALRRGHINTLSISRVVEVVVDKFGALTIGAFFWATAPVLLATRAVGLVGSSIVLGKCYTPLDWRTGYASISRAKRVAIRYRQYPLFGGPAILFFGMARNLPLIMLGTLFSAETVGQYGMALRIIETPLFAFGDSAFRSFFREISKNQGISNNHQAATESLFSGVLSLTLCPLIIFFFVSSTLFGLVMGQEWAQSGGIAGWLVVLGVGSLIVRPFSAFFHLFDRQWIRMVHGFSVAVFSNVGVIVGYYLSHNILFTVVLSACSVTAIELLFGCLALKIAKIDIVRVLRSSVYPICVAVVAAISFLAIKEILKLSGVFLLCVAFVTVILNFLVVYRQHIPNLLSRKFGSRDSKF